MNDFTIGKTVLLMVHQIIGPVPKWWRMNHLWEWLIHTFISLTQVIWSCLVEDSALFLRYVLERLTREKQELMFKILRHLIRFIPKLPQQAAFALYNYIIGYVMFYVRSPQEDGQKLIGTAISVLWMVSVKVKVFVISCFINLSDRKDMLSRFWNPGFEG